VDELDPLALDVRRASVRGVDLAYLREGKGGFALVIVHGSRDRAPVLNRAINYFRLDLLGNSAGNG
jgi:hypothetical protein